jgi:hypothetical protein
VATCSRSLNGGAIREAESLLCDVWKGQRVVTVCRSVGLWSSLDGLYSGRLNERMAFGVAPTDILQCAEGGDFGTRRAY